MNILMLSKSHYRGDVRVRREAMALVGEGHLVSVISTDDDSYSADGVSVIGTGEMTGLKPRSGHADRSSIAFRGARWALLPEHRERAVVQFQTKAMAKGRGLTPVPDVVHAHDFPALSVGSALADSYGARLVYDAHEFWPGLPRYGRPEPWRRRRHRELERDLITKADKVITVSDGAARLLQTELGAREVVVIRNAFPVRYDLRPPERPSGALYGGRIGAGRDLETVFTSDAWKGAGALTLHLMGPRDLSFSVPEWAVIHETGTMDEVDAVLSKVGIGLVTLTRGPLNHDVALPNKLFQAVAVGVPVVAADLPEIATLLSNHPVGALYEPGDASSLAKAMRQVVKEYDSYLNAVAEARPQLEWDKEAAKLIAVYDDLEGSD